MPLTPAATDPNRDEELARKKKEPHTFGDFNNYDASVKNEAARKEAESKASKKAGKDDEKSK